MQNIGPKGARHHHLLSCYMTDEAHCVIIIPLWYLLLVVIIIKTTVQRMVHPSIFYTTYPCRVGRSNDEPWTHRRQDGFVWSADKMKVWMKRWYGGKAGFMFQHDNKLLETVWTPGAPMDFIATCLFEAEVDAYDYHTSPQPNCPFNSQVKNNWTGPWKNLCLCDIHILTVTFSNIHGKMKD